MNEINLKIKKALKKHSSRFYRKKALNILNFLLETNFNYIFSWKGVPVIQLPTDLLVIQELINKNKPDVIIECGLAHGGSILFYESVLNSYKKKYKIFGIDIKISSLTKINIKKNKISNNIKLIQKDSSDVELIDHIKLNTKKNDKFLIILDSNHSYEHVMKELNNFSKLIKKGGYIVVLDTTLEFINQKFIKKGRNFGKGNSPHKAVVEFVRKNKSFKIDKDYHLKSYITSAIDGFLKRIK